MGAAGRRVVNGVLKVGDWVEAVQDAATEAGIDPRWTGMCSACASISPLGRNTATEQSALSLMLGESEECRSTVPISSATEARR